VIKYNRYTLGGDTAVRTKIHIKNAYIRNNELLLQPDETFEGSTYLAKEQVLADSEHHLFI